MKIKIAVYVVILFSLAAGVALYPGAEATMCVPDGRGSFTVASSPQPLYYKLLSPAAQAERIFASLAEPQKGIVPKGVILGKVEFQDTDSVLILDFESFPAVEAEQERVFLNSVTKTMYTVFPEVKSIQFRIRGTVCQSLGGNYTAVSTREHPVGSRGKMVELWYSDRRHRLHAVERWLAQDSGNNVLIKEVVAALKRAPANLQSILPSACEVVGVEVDGSVAAINFDNLSELSTVEAYLLLDGLTKTLFGSFPELQAVELRVEGEPVSEIGGIACTADSLGRSKWTAAVPDSTVFSLEQLTIQHGELAPQLIDPEQPITFAKAAKLRFVLNKPFDPSLFAASWKQLAQEVSPLFRTQQGWEIAVQLTTDRLQYGQDAVVALNFPDLEGNLITKDLQLSRVYPPEVVEFSCITYPERVSCSEAVDPEMVYYLPPGKVKFYVQFSKPVQKASVEKALMMQRSTRVVLAWENDNALKLELQLNDGETYYVSFEGFLDIDNVPIDDDRYYCMVGSRPSALFAAEIYSREQQRITEYPITVRGAAASPGIGYLLLKDLVSKNQPPRYDIYLWDREQQTLQRLIECAASIIEPVWSPKEALFVYGSALYDLSGQTQLKLGEVAGAAFSPDGSKLLVILKQDSRAVVRIYDLRTRAAEVSAEIDLDSGMHQPLSVYWLSEGSVLLGCPERNTILKLKPRDFSLEELNVNGYRFIVSPHEDLLVYWQGEAVYLYELQTGKSRRLPLDSVNLAFWSPSGVRLVLQHESGKLYFYDTQLDYLKELTEDGTPVGWIEKGKVLLYR